MQILQVSMMNLVLILIHKELQVNIICKAIFLQKDLSTNYVLKLSYLEP